MADQRHLYTLLGIEMVSRSLLLDTQTGPLASRCANALDPTVKEAVRPAVLSKPRQVLKRVIHSPPVLALMKTSPSVVAVGGR